MTKPIEMKSSTLFDLEKQGKVYRHHTASRRGYLSQKIGQKVESYKGRFGAGYILVEPHRLAVNMYQSLITF